ncbi:MAG: HAD family phosphatase [Rhodocyclaceae bacterium]|nr:HAD family phosphatase [Rhodocyclaceae bacterium]
MSADEGAIRAVIFDMDGVLLDSERIAYAIGRDVCHDMGIPWRHEVAMQMIGLNSREHERLLKGAYGEDFPVAEHHEEFGRRYEAAIHAGAIPLKPGVLELLDLLDRLDLPRAVATSTRRNRALPKLDAVGLLKRMDGVVGGDEVPRGKPAPDIFQAAATLLETRTTACLVIEDSNAGVRGALAAGARVVMVPDLLQPADDVLAAGVRVEPDLAAVRRWLTPTGDGAGPAPGR